MPILVASCFKAVMRKGPRRPAGPHSIWILLQYKYVGGCHMPL